MSRRRITLLAVGFVLAAATLATAGAGLSAGAPGTTESAGVLTENAADTCTMAPVVCSPIASVSVLAAVEPAAIPLIAAAVLAMCAVAIVRAPDSRAPAVLTPPPRYAS